MKVIKTVLFGLGTVNIGFLKILMSSHRQLIQEYSLSFKIIAVADSSGFAVCDHGFDFEALISLKMAKAKISSLKDFQAHITTENCINRIEGDLLIESSPGNLKDGNPGLSVSMLALQKGWSVVFANKAPLIFLFDRLHQLCSEYGGKVAYSSTVCGGLPVINVLKRDLKLASLIRLRGIFNATTNYILQELDKGGTMEDAIKEAQRLGAAEADPTHDIHGHDTANKLFIIMKSFTSYAGSISDIEVTGIQHVKREQLIEAKLRSKKIKLVASAEPNESGWKLCVKPTEVDADSFLATCEGWEMGIEINTDFYESIAMKNYEADPMGTSAAVLRDAIDLCLQK